MLDLSRCPCVTLSAGGASGTALSHLALAHCPRLELSGDSSAVSAPSTAAVASDGMPASAPLPFGMPQQFLSLAGLPSRAAADTVLRAIHAAGRAPLALDLSDSRLSVIAATPNGATRTDHGFAAPAARTGTEPAGRLREDSDETVDVSGARAPRSDGYFDMLPGANDSEPRGAGPAASGVSRASFDMASLPLLPLHLLWASSASNTNHQRPANAIASSSSLARLAQLDLSGCVGVRDADFSYAHFECRARWPSLELLRLSFASPLSVAHVRIHLHTAATTTEESESSSGSSGSKTQSSLAAHNPALARRHSLPQPPMLLLRIEMFGCATDSSPAPALPAQRREHAADGASLRVPAHVRLLTADGHLTEGGSALRPAGSLADGEVDLEL